MTADTKEIWIRTGYANFALSGLAGLKIEPLAKQVGKSKSSFYHHFANGEVFLDYLLKHHLEQSAILALKEKKAQNISPELIQILVEHKVDLLFNRQLRIGQNIKEFANTLARSNQIVGDGFKDAWARDVNIHLSQKQLEGVFALAIENFFLQINEDNVHFEWLSTYFKNLKLVTANFL